MTELEEMIQKYVSPFEDTEQAERVITHMISRGYRPSSAAATLSYLLSDGVTQAEAADKFGSTTVSIRKHVERVEELINQNEHRNNSED